MFFGLLGLANMLGPPQFKGAIPRKDQKPTPSGPVVAGIIVAIVSLVVVINLATHSVPGMLATLAIPVIAGLIFVSLFVNGATEAARKQDAVRKMNIPAPPPATLAADLRVRASELRGGISVLDRPPVTAPAPVPASRTITVRQLREDKDEDTRLMRVAAILVSACPECESEEAELCRPIEGVTWYALDQPRGLFAHARRIGSAVRTRTAKIEDVVAQFDGNVPDNVWEATL